MTVAHITKSSADAYYAKASCTCGWVREFDGWRRARLAREEADRHAAGRDVVRPIGPDLGKDPR